MKDRSIWRTISIGILALAIVFFSASGPEKTGAWFVDSGTWVTASYGVGVIDYTVYIDGKNIEKIKEGQNVNLAVPLIAAAKINEMPKTVVAVTSGGIVRGAHDEFDEGVTLIRTKIVNHGGLPVALTVDVEASALTSGGMLCIPLPYNTAVDETQYQAGGLTYKEYIKQQLGITQVTPVADWDSYEKLTSAVTNYWNAPASDGRLNRVIKYDGKLPSIDPKDVSPDSPGFDMVFLCWAEYDQMSYSQGEQARNNSKAIAAAQGKLVLNITCTL